MARKTFSTPDPRKGDPIEFDLEVVRLVEDKQFDDEHGQPLDEPRLVKVERRETHTFRAHPDVSGGKLVQIELMGTGNGKNVRKGDALFDFYDSALLPEDSVRFRELIEADDVYVHAELLGEIAGWLYQQYAGRGERPTSQA